MTPERWRRIEELFRAALEREGGQRAAFLDEACADDPSLRREVESLIASHEQAESFLVEPALAVFTEPLTDREANSIRGRRIGPYKVLHEIGRGGMGLVYLAVRADAQYQKRVAIKLLKRGMDTDSILRRFRNEQQVLAALDHPNIAKIIDGGVTDDGLSYFIMEYVEGLPIDAYCDTHKLSTAERLKLFRTVCSAVHYAHQNLIVHRDLKPSNILVTAEGVPKLLDFGIAKLLNPELSPETIDPTAAPLRPMTPEYASPEQVRGEPITPASDIYSLGVLLYELLTGHRPYRVHRRTPQEVEHVICEEEPEKPSTVIRCVEEVHDMDGTHRLTPELVSETREGQPKKLRRRLAGDLDNVVLMALRKEPERRYASVEQLSEDIRCHLEGLPVIACKDTLRYRSAKFIKRNKAGVIAATLALMLVALIAVGLYLPARRDTGINKVIRSVAVLPLENLSGDPAQEYFADGMMEALITNLAQIRALRVISRTSVMQYKGARKPLPEIAQKLQVDAVVEGSVQQFEDRVRITVQLIHAATDQHMWAEAYDRDLRDVLALQSEVARAIARAINIKLTPQEQARLASARPINREAYEAYLMGRYFWNKTTEEAVNRGIRYFEQAIKKDPNYALAYAGLADSYILLWELEALSTKEAYPNARAAATRALEIDGSLAEAHTSLAGVRMFFEWAWLDAEREFKRAIELNPGLARTYTAYSIYLRCMGRLDEAMVEMKRAQELDPLSLDVNNNVAWLFYLARQYDQVFKQCQKTLEMDPNFSQAFWALGMAYGLKGMYQEAIAALQKASLEHTSWILASLGHAYAVSGERGKAEELLGQLKELSKHRYVPPDEIALIYIGLGEKDQAFRWLQKAYEERTFFLIWLKLDPLFDSLRSDPRFADLVRRIGFPP